MKRVVIDTNVLVSGLLFDGVPGELITLWKARSIQPLCSREIVHEYVRVLAYPRFRLSESEIDYLLSEEILPWFEILEVPPGEPFVGTDPHDDKFIWCAMVGKVEVIICGDEHLLRLAPWPVPVLTAAAFLRELRRKHD